MRTAIIFIFMVISSHSLQAQTNWGRVISGTIKAGRALTITDEDLSEAVKKEVELMDRNNKVCSKNSSYTKRLQKLTKGMVDAEGIPLNFKVYMTKEVNAFACPDGSVRVYSALMDALTDNELLGVLGHEIGHVALRHSKKAWRSAMLRSAASDAIGSRSETWATISDSFLGDISSIALSASNSRYHETQADEYGYRFISSIALSASNSRYHETQADEYGYRFLRKCGKNPMAMVSMLEKLKKLSENKNSRKYKKWLQAFSSHPDFDKRIEHIKNLSLKNN